MDLEKREKVSSLQGVEITSFRRHGNTTRIADNAIQQLFHGKCVKIQDHFAFRTSNERLAKLIIKRLKNEHPGREFLFNKDKLEIVLT